MWLVFVLLICAAVVVVTIRALRRRRVGHVLAARPKSGAAK